MNNTSNNEHFKHLKYLQTTHKETMDNLRLHYDYNIKSIAKVLLLIHSASNVQVDVNLQLSKKNISVKIVH